VLRLVVLADTRLNQEDKLNLRAFHDSLWKNGTAPIALLRWEGLGLRDEIRCRMRHNQGQARIAKSQA
jgi:hypothetical protein